MDFPPLIGGVFIKRENRFRVKVEVGGEVFTAHLPNSGRLEELLSPGRAVFVSREAGKERKTPFDLKIVKVGEILVSVDARLPRFIFQEAIEKGRLPDFHGYRVIRGEPRYRGGRFDVLLEGPGGQCLVETKSVTLVKEGVALFPDAPTERGRRHLLELKEALGEGIRAAVVFIIQRQDAFAFSPNFTADPAFVRAFREAVKAGVEALAYTCSVTERRIEIKGEVPVIDLD
ncbi:MAG: DNA/RNA nuclease SfsA [Anaerolineae bacterium]|nr:DNA/RNA nuclease SfsA [Anaerolineae bacterium]MDW8103220.1 DNA/RNA nuclease SfsA [Anaerolineae bacterium]